MLLLLVDGLPASELPGAVPLECYVGFRGVEASLFTGTETADHGIWTDFRRGAGSPYRWVRCVPGLLHVYRGLPRSLQYFTGTAVHQLTRAAGRRPALPKSSLIPLDILAQMEFSSASLPWVEAAYGSLPTVFDRLRECGRSFACLAPPSVTRWRTTDDKVMAVFRRALCQDVKDFYYLKFVDLDRVSHRLGPDSVPARRVLSRTLSRIEEVLSLLRDRCGEVRSVVLSDHGFLPVERHLNVEARLRSWRRLYGDFTYFLDSTMVRCWCSEDGSRLRLMSYLDHEQGLTRLDDDLRRRYGLSQLPRAYGELVYMVEHGSVLWPDFFWRYPPRGMHGYLPHPRLEPGIVVRGSPFQPQPGMRFTDVKGILLRMLELQDR